MTLDSIAYQKAINEENIKDVLDFIQNSPLKRTFLEYFNDKGNTAFHIIAAKGKPEDLEVLKLSQPNPMAGINRKNNQGQTGLHLACLRNDLLMVEAFVKNGAYITIADVNGSLPLHIAAVIGSLPITNLLCEEGKKRNQVFEQSYLPAFLQESKFDIDAKNKQHQSSYRLARKNNFISIMNKLKSHGGQDNYELAKIAISHDQIKDLESLIEKYPYILKDSDEAGDTLIHHLMLRNHPKAQYLIEKMVKLGADINAVNDGGQTPLHYFAQMGFQQGQGTQILDTLLRLGAKVRQGCHKGLNALHFAAGQNNITVIDYLISKGASVTDVSNDGLTVLHLAALFNRFEAFKHLVERCQADINALTYPSACVLFPMKEKAKEVSVLWIATYCESQKIVEYIVDFIVNYFRG